MKVGVVVPAHDEEAVVGRLLGSLAPAESDDGLVLEVIVVCNGCSDGTAARARAAAPWARVSELSEAGKAAALQVGDDLLSSWPRFYVDADVLLRRDDLRVLAQDLASQGPYLAVAPTVVHDVRRSSWVVRSYYRVASLLPAYDRALFGTGVIGVSETGRRRFGTWPRVIADDFFIDALFEGDEKRRHPSAQVNVVAPRRLPDLVRRKTRVRTGNVEAQRSGLRDAQPRTGLCDVLRAQPRRAPDVLLFAGIAAWCRLCARLPGRSGVWSRDASRSPA